MAEAIEGTRQTYPLRTVRAAMCLYAAGGETRLQDEDIESILGIETAGMVALWRNRERGGSWEAKRVWVESDVEDEEEDRPFEMKEQRELLKSSVRVAGKLLKKCEDGIDGKDIEFIKGVKPTARNMIEGLQRAHVIINKDTTQLREIEESIRDDRQIEEERVRRILRQMLRAVELTPEQLEAMRKEFPRMLPVVSERMPMVVAEV